MVLYIVISIISLIKEKFNYKKIIYSIIFFVLSLLIFISLGDKIQIYSKNSILSFILIIVLFLLNYFDLKIVKNYSFIVYLYIFFVYIKTIFLEIKILFYMKEITSTMNYQFLVSNVMFLILILFMEYLKQAKLKKC